MVFLKRQDILLGEGLSNYIQNKRVAIIGVGGVGGAALEALVRAGINEILVWDNGIIDVTNLNRQILATKDVLGHKKVDVAKDRILNINENCQVTIIDDIYMNENRDILLKYKPDFVVDAIDTISHKLDLIECCYSNKISVISSMGTGNKINNSEFYLGKIEDTKGQKCPMARIMRKKLKHMGVNGIDVIYSKADVYSKNVISSNGRHSPGSISFCPPVSGYLMAGFVINRFIENFNG